MTGRRSIGVALSELVGDSVSIGSLPIGATFTLHLLSLAVPLAAVHLIDYGIIQESPLVVTAATVGLLASLGLSFALRKARNAIRHQVADSVEYQAYTSAADRVINGRYVSSGSNSVDRLTHGVKSSCFSAIGSCIGKLRIRSDSATMDGIFCCLFVLGIGFLSPTMALAAAVLLCLQAAVSVGMVRFRQSDHGFQAVSGVETRRAILSQIKSAANTLFAYGYEPTVFSRLNSVHSRAASETYLDASLASRFDAQGSVFGSLTLMILVGAGCFQIIGGTLSLGALFASTVLALQAQVLVKERMEHAFHHVDYQNSQEEINRFLNLTAEPTSALTSPMAPVVGHIVLREVQLVRNVLSGTASSPINLTIEPGEFIGILPREGNYGKELLELLRGERGTVAGSVRIDGVDPVSEEGAVVRRATGFVTRETALFSGSLIENISLDSSADARHRAQEVARSIGLETRIFELPLGYGTHLNEDVRNSSPSGFLQQIGLARALAQSPRILLLDEATADVDITNDQAILEGLAGLRGTMTMVVISSRPSILRLSDRLFELDGQLLRNLDSGELPVSTHSIDIPSQNQQVRA